LQTRGSELCHAIVGPPWVRNHLLEMMRLVARLHTKLAKELATLRATVSSTTELVLGRSPDDAFRVEVVGELAVEFQKIEDWHSQLERPTARICDWLLGPLPDRARLANRLDEVVRWLRVELAAWWEADLELEAPRTLAARVWGSVLGSTEGPSSLAASLFVAAELLERQNDSVAANGVHWGFHSALVATVSHFPS
jgi:hypothetical protein